MKTCQHVITSLLTLALGPITRNKHSFPCSPLSCVSTATPSSGPLIGPLRWRPGGCEPQHLELMDSVAPRRGSRHVRARRMQMPRPIIDSQWESWALTKLIIWTNVGPGWGEFALWHKTRGNGRVQSRRRVVGRGCCDWKRCCDPGPVSALTPL